MADINEKLFSDFPPVSTDAWMEKITVDLKGADFEKKLVWKTNEGFKVKPFYRREDLEGLKRAVAAMIGLGVGLTPSGDDFLVGLLLALSVGLPGRMEPVLEELKAHIRRFSGGTNDISRQYLLCACRGEYSLRLHELLQAGAEGKGIRTALEKTAEIGHSSGVDTLNGLLAGIKIIQETLEEKTGEKEGTVW